MAYGEYQGMCESDPRLRAMFTRESLLESEWYRERLLAKKAVDIALWTRHRDAVNSPVAQRRLAHVSSPAYLDELAGTIGADPSLAAK